MVRRLYSTVPRFHRARPVLSATFILFTALTANDTRLYVLIASVLPTTSRNVMDVRNLGVRIVSAQWIVCPHVMNVGYIFAVAALSLTAVLLIHNVIVEHVRI